MNKCVYVRLRAYIAKSGGKEVFTMNGSGRDPGAGIGLILLVVILYIIFNPIPGPIDDLAVAGIGAYSALKGG